MAVVGMTRALWGCFTGTRLAVAAIAVATIAQGAWGTEVAHAVGPAAVGQIANQPSQEGAILTEQGSRYRYIVVRDTMHEHVDEIRAANPDTDILVYKDLSFIINDPACEWVPFQATGVDYCDANPHEDWFLHNSSGQRLSTAGGFMLAGNIANTAYRQAWVEGVLDRLRDANNDGSNVEYDGVFMDDTNLFPGHGMEGQIAEMSDSQYRQATVSFIDYLGPALEQEGFKVVPNLGIGTWDPAQRAAAVQLAPDVTAISREQFVRYSQSPLFTDPVSDAGSWIDEITLAEEVQAAGAGFVAVVYGTADEIQVQRYARASYLLVWNGSESGFMAYRTSGGDSFFPDSTTDVGTPLAPRERMGVGWQRFFTEGAVVVNPHPNVSQAFSLDGLYRRPDGTCVDTVTLAPRHGLVLPACPRPPVAGPPVPSAPPDPPAPPETEITDGPDNLTKDTRATFGFTATEPGSTFECRVESKSKNGKGKKDSTNFAPCTSPFTVKVKPGKHEFHVRATDQAGNTDPSPATDDWKVKRKRKRKR
jgi:Hypothetical glycosyl hydrolase family 15/Bacterial Ig-like domain